MRKQASGMENPLLEAGASSTSNHRVAFRHEGKLLEPIAGQFLMDFSEREKVVTSTPVPDAEPSPRENEAAAWFARGIALEEDPSHADRSDRRLSQSSRVSSPRTRPRTSI